MKHLSVLASILKKEGVVHAFGVTGGGPSLHLIQALIDLGVTYHPAAHEAAAAMMAGAACRMGETKAITVGIKGPGFANFFPGIVSNHYENRPTLLVVEHYMHAMPSFVMHKRLNHETAGKEIFKAKSTCDERAKVATELMATARAEAPGPTLLQIAKAPDESAMATMPPVLWESGNLHALCERIGQAQRPALILGGVVARHYEGQKLAQVTVPVATTAAGKGCFNETSPYSAGIVTGEVKQLSPEHAVLRKADLLIAVGLRNTEVVIPKAYRVPLLSLDLIDGTIGGYFRGGIEPTMEVVHPDLTEALDEIVDTLSGHCWGGDLVAARQQSLAELFGEAWAPPMAFKMLPVSEDITLVLDTGYFCTVGETVWQATSPRSFCGSSNGRFMGTAVPTAIGLSIAEPDRKVICVCGDGGIRPYLAEIRLAVARQLPILFVLMTDGLYGSIAWTGRTLGFNEDAFTIKDNSWLAVIEAMGLPAYAAHNADEMAKLPLLPKHGPAFLELHFDPKLYYESASELR